jgi:hypothetical protein
MLIYLLICEFRGLKSKLVSKIACESVKLIHVSQNSFQGFRITVILVNDREYFVQLSDYHLLRKNDTAWN